MADCITMPMLSRWGMSIRHTFYSPSGPVKLSAMRTYYVQGSYKGAEEGKLKASKFRKGM